MLPCSLFSFFLVFFNESSTVDAEGMRKALDGNEYSFSHQSPLYRRWGGTFRYKTLRFSTEKHPHNKVTVYDNGVGTDSQNVEDVLVVEFGGADGSHGREIYDILPLNGQRLVDFQTSIANMIKSALSGTYRQACTWSGLWQPCMAAAPLHHAHAPHHETGIKAMYYECSWWWLGWGVYLLVTGDAPHRGQRVVGGL